MLDLRSLLCVREGEWHCAWQDIVTEFAGTREENSKRAADQLAVRHNAFVFIF